MQDGLLAPILVCGLGRSGSTALMALLASDEGIALDGVYPYENCLLSYCTKLALLQGRYDRPGAWNVSQLIDFNDSGFGAYPYHPEVTSDSVRERVLSLPTLEEWMRQLWEVMSSPARKARPSSSRYAEKVPPWLPSHVRDVLGAQTIYLFRDPRDIYLSANAFMRKLNYLSFGRQSGDSEGDYARTLAHGFLELFENYRADRDRADCLLVRYEDLIAQRSTTTACLARFLNARLDESALERSSDYHVTAGTPRESVARWKREAPPRDVSDILTDNLQEAMAALGYEHEASGASHQGVRTLDCSDASHVRGLEPNAHGIFSGVSEDGLAIRLQGDDFFVMLPPNELEAASIHECWLTVHGQAGTHCSVYWAGPGEAFSETRALHVPFFPASHWQVVRFRLRSHPEWKGAIRRIRFDVCNGGVILADSMIRLRSIRLVG
jgi:hypothetical protein